MKKKDYIVMTHYGNKPKEETKLSEKIILAVLIISLVFIVGYGIYNLCTI
jgi:hypothetical protein